VILCDFSISDLIYCDLNCALICRDLILCDFSICDLIYCDLSCDLTCDLIFAILVSVTWFIVSWAVT